jgi:hypothetical protein
MDQLRCKDLRPGDILLKVATDWKWGGLATLKKSATQGFIKGYQRLTGQVNSFLGHAAIVLDGQSVVEAQSGGLTNHHLATANRDCGYIVYRPNDPSLGRGAANAAKLLLDVHGLHGNLGYGLGGALMSGFGGTGTAKSAADFDGLLDRILAGRGSSFFCSQFVVYVYQWAASQKGLSPGSVFAVSDAKASPSVLASKLVGNGRFKEVGYMLPGER